MATQEEVEAFLKQFHQKLKVFSIIFRDERGKNAQTLADLEITPKYRETIIKAIEVEDYSQGPIVDTLNHLGDMWVFGKDVKGHEIYIKISLGRDNCQTICISFHIAEYRMKYPHLKEENDEKPFYRRKCKPSARKFRIGISQREVSIHLSLL